MTLDVTQCTQLSEIAGSASPTSQKIGAFGLSVSVGHGQGLRPAFRSSALASAARFKNAGVDKNKITAIRTAIMAIPGGPIWISERFMAAQL